MAARLLSCMALRTGSRPLADLKRYFGEDVWSAMDGEQRRQAIARQVSVPTAARPPPPSPMPAMAPPMPQLAAPRWEDRGGPADSSSRAPPAEGPPGAGGVGSGIKRLKVLPPRVVSKRTASASASPSAKWAHLPPDERAARESAQGRARGMARQKAKVSTELAKTKKRVAAVQAAKLREQTRQAVEEEHARRAAEDRLLEEDDRQKALAALDDESVRRAPLSSWQTRSACAHGESSCCCCC